MSFSIGPNSDGHPGNSHYFKKHLADALSLGFVILSAPRIGTPRSPDIGKELYGTRSDAEMRSQQNLCFDVFDFLNNLGCGIAVAKALGDAHKRGERRWLDALDNVPDADQIKNGEMPPEGAKSKRRSSCGRCCWQGRGDDPKG